MTSVESSGGTQTDKDNSTYSISVSQSGTLEITVKTKSNYYISGVNLMGFDCANRSSSAEIKYMSNFSLNWNKYLNNTTITNPSGNKYNYSGSSLGTYDNVDNRFKVEWVSEDTYKITIDLNIGSIATGAGYYQGGNVTITLAQKQFDGNIEVL